VKLFQKFTTLLMLSVATL